MVRVSDGMSVCLRVCLQCMLCECGRLCKSSCALEYRYDDQMAAMWEGRLGKRRITRRALHRAGLSGAQTRKTDRAVRERHFGCADRAKKCEHANGTFLRRRNVFQSRNQ